MLNPFCIVYYRCVEDYFETFVQGYDEKFSRQYGFWRPYLLIAIWMQPAPYLIQGRSPQRVCPLITLITNP
jgi:hypothetical protein